MPTLNLFAACERVLVDPLSDRISLIGVLDKILPEAFNSASYDDAKFLMPQLFFATVWAATPEDAGATYEQMTRIVAKSDEKTTQATEPMDFTVEDEFVRLVQPIRITCRSAGRFTFALYLRHKGSEDWGEPRAEFLFTLMEPESKSSDERPLFQGEPMEANKAAEL